MLQPWFAGAKLGIFVHWGIYAVNGIAESWSFFNGQISYEDYMAQAKGFTAKHYDPAAWADLFVRAGAKYAVLTAKHHDGFALWDTKLSRLSAVHGSPAKRDLVGPYVDALRTAGIKVGIYFSHLDWSHPDYASVFDQNHRPGGQFYNAPFNRFAFPPKDAPEDYNRWRRFIEFHRGQLEELCTLYQPDLLWFDGDWERDDEQWNMGELRELLHRWAPGVILNSRMRGHGDYATPEQGIPVAAPKGPWEFCVTINDSWGYQPRDTNHKSVRQIVRMMAECVGMGGNVLLDVGPRPDGVIQPEHVQRLEGMGRWTHRHAESLYGTVAGLPHGHHYGPSTLSEDRTTLYLFFFDTPRDGVAVKGIRNNIRRASIVGSGREIAHRKIGGAPWANIPGVLWLDVPGDALDSDCTVIKLELEKPLDLDLGHGHVITAN